MLLNAVLAMVPEVLGPSMVCDETNLIASSRRTKKYKIEHKVDAARDECAALLAGQLGAKVDAARDELDNCAALLAGHGHCRPTRRRVTVDKRERC